MKLDWKAVLGLTISAALIWWLFRNEDFGEIWSQIRSADPWLFGWSIVVATSAYLIRVIRWGVLLHPIAPGTTFYNRWATTMIGFMANNLLVARIGEFLRAYAVARVEPRLTVSGAFGTLVVERFLDVVAVVLILAAVVALPSFPDSATLSGRPVDGLIRLVVMVLGLGIVGLALLLVSPERSSSLIGRGAHQVLPDRVAERLVALLTSFLGGLEVLRRPVLLTKALFWSLAHWLFYGTSFLLGIKAFGIELGYGAALFTQGLVGFGVAIPSSPGFFGTWHAAAQVALSGVYGVDETLALSFATAYHLGGFVPITVLGLYYAWRLGISVKEVPTEASEVAAGAPAPGR